MGLKQYTISRYTAAQADAWNALVARSQQATFLFDRGFMDYHADRFEDHSLLVFDNDALVAVLPANISDGYLYSHQGLTYGGLLYNDLRLEEVIAVFRSVLAYAHAQGISHLQYKTIPSIYHQKPQHETEYALFLANAQLVRRDSLAVLGERTTATLSDLRKRGVAKGTRHGLQVREVNEFASFWHQILIPNLAARHQASPVHTAAEMTLLAQRFPQNIRQFNVYDGEQLVAGTTLFVTKTVAHAQYIAADDRRQELGSLDFLFQKLAFDIFADKPWFDFGISNEQQGRKLNAGLSYWKESFGATTIVHDFYEVPTANFALLDDVFI